MNYNIIDIINKNLTDTDLKEIINRKIFNIIELLEIDLNY